MREVDLVDLMLVCRRFNEIANLPSLWRSLFLRVFEMEAPYTIPVSTHNLPSSSSSSSSLSSSLSHIHTSPTHQRSSTPSQAQAVHTPTTELSWKEQFSLMVRFAKYITHIQVVHMCSCSTTQPCLLLVSYTVQHSCLNY